ncbi:MAG: adenylate/guanylate cyclase domain-containing protein, partial [Actinomycetota bacterium]
DHLLFAPGSDAILDPVEEFITGSRREAVLDRVLATCLFTDIVGSTEKAALFGDAHWGTMLAAHQDMVRSRLKQFGGKEIKTTGDGFLATFDGPTRAVSCAKSISRDSRLEGNEIRAGLHTGEIEFRRGDGGEQDIAGIGVHIAARVMALAGASEVLVSSTVKDLVAGSGLEFDDRGAHELKGVPGQWRLFAAH